MWSDVRTSIRILAFVWAVLGAAATARAQSLVVGDFDAGVDSWVHSIAVQADGKILIGGTFTTVGFTPTGTVTRNGLARLNTDGSIDTTFSPGCDSGVFAVAIQADGKIVVGGGFTKLGGGGMGSSLRRNIGRFLSNGTLDTTFNPGANGYVRRIAIQADGKILVAGEFTMLGGGTTGTTARNFIGRLNADGSLDTTFNPGANGRIDAIAVQADGKIVLGGSFTALGGGTGVTPRQHIGRLNADGTVDAGFDPGADQPVTTLAAQSDGKILAGGDFTRLGGGGAGVAARGHIGRINADGSIDTGFDPGVVLETVPSATNVRTIALQPDGRILVGGMFTAIGGGTGTTPRRVIARLEANGAVDPGFDPGAAYSTDPNQANVFAFAVQADGRVLIGGIFNGIGGGTGALARTFLARVGADGSVGGDYNPGADGRVLAVAMQPDGKAIVGGKFSRMGGGATVYRNRIARLKADGSVDDAFDPGAIDQVNAIAVQPDGKIVIAGAFLTYGGGSPGTLISRRYLGRVNADGSVDTTFTAFTSDYVYALAVQADGKIVVGGSFEFLNGTARKHVGRLNADGTLDLAFNPGTNGGSCVFGCTTPWPSGVVTTVAVQPDGKILVGGDFTALGGGTGTVTRRHLGRLYADGTVDPTFDPSPTYVTGGQSDPANVYAIQLQADGKIVVGGYFTNIAGGGRRSIARLNADGSLDAGFNSSVDYYVYTLAIQADGKIVAGGNFTALGGGGRSRIGRLNPDGSLDMTFDPGADGPVYGLALAPDGKVLVGGEFTRLGGGPRANIGWISNADPIVQRVETGAAGTTVTWWRSGPAPEVSRVTFESASYKSSSYTLLGTATRIPGGWQLAGLSLPLNQVLLIRARGYYGTGQGNGSGSIVEYGTRFNVAIQAPGVAAPPAAVTVAVGETASFSVTESGTAGADVQWQVSADGGATWTDISGATASTYSFTATLADSGKQFRAVLTNSVASVPTSAATLTVTKATPIITWANPASIVAGTPLGSAQLNASASVPGTFVYTPPSGTVMEIGAGLFLSVTFTPADGTRYETATKTVPIDVVTATHPADADGNGALAIGEVTAYGAAWKRGMTWAAAPNPIPIGYVTRAGYLWRNGEGYHFTAGEGPACWVAGGASAAALVASADARASGAVATVVVTGTAADRVVARIVIHVIPKPGTLTWALEERLPAGWVVTSVSGGGTWDAAEGRVRWGLSTAAGPQDVEYSVTVPGTDSGTAMLIGVVSFDGADQPVGGTRRVGWPSRVR